MGWLPTIGIWLVIAGCAWLVGWVMGDWQGYDRATDEYLRTRRTPPMRFPKILKDGLP